MTRRKKHTRTPSLRTRWKQGPKPPLDPHLLVALKDTYNQYTKAEKEKLEYFFEIGRIATAIKASVAHGSFLRTIDDAIPDFGERSVQIAMKLSRTFMIFSYPALLNTCQDNLHTISKKYSRDQIDEILESNPIFKQEDFKSSAELMFFRRAIRDMIDERWLYLDEPSWVLKEQEYPDEETQSPIIHPSGWTEVAVDTPPLVEELLDEEKSTIKISKSIPRQYRKYIKRFRITKQQDNGKLTENNANLLISITKESALTLTKLTPEALNTPQFHEKVQSIIKILSDFGNHSPISHQSQATQPQQQ